MSDNLGSTQPGMIREICAPAWRFWLWPEPLGETHMVYVTATPENLQQVSALLGEFVTCRCPDRLSAIRFVGSPEVLAQCNRMSEWAGKAITLYLPSKELAEATAQQIDALLAGQGLSGPPALRARPFGGRSGLVFLRSAAGASAGNSRRDRLSALLGGVGE